MTVPTEKRLEQKRRCENNRRRKFTPEQKEHIRKQRREHKDTENAKNRLYYEEHRNEINENRKKAYALLTEEEKKRLASVRRQWLLRKIYKMTEEQFSVMLESQGHLCAICRGGTNGGRQWHIDHCHTTGQVRGILCGNCNKMLGLAKDSPTSLRNAASYLERFIT